MRGRVVNDSPLNFSKCDRLKSLSLYNNIDVNGGILLMYNLNLTEEELEFVYTRCLRKAMRLEEAHLKDIPCYELANKIMWKINDLRKPPKELKENNYG